MQSAIVWVNKWTFRVRHPNGRATDVIIPGVDKMDRKQAIDLVQWQTEETLGELSGPEPVAPPHSKAFQHDLGRTLMAIERTKELVKATGHGRYY